MLLRKSLSPFNRKGNILDEQEKAKLVGKFK